MQERIIYLYSKYYNYFTFKCLLNSLRMKYLSLGLLVFILSFPGISQESILDMPLIQEKVENCLASTYNYEFSKARALQKEIREELPKHPVTNFLNALIIYWENMPLLPKDPQADEFLSSMQRSVRKSKLLLKEDPNSVEGVFFDLHARAFMVMFWADNGKPARVLKEIDNLYRRTMQGKDMKEKFNEFYFSSGLYSYYIEAYVELHPIYKPVAVLFRKGDKEIGLEELQRAIDSTTYIQVEALLFMSLLQLNYEKEMDQALEYAAVLYNNYPKNTYYIGHYLMILLYQDEFELAQVILEGLGQKEDKYSHMIYTIMQGFIIENNLNNLTDAKSNYLDGIEIAEEFGPFADIYKAIAYAGLSRISLKTKNKKLSKKHRRKSKSLSNYEFILDYE
jgi:hypothetical protein